MITLDYLPKTNIQLYQDDEMIRINTDTEVLGEFLEVYRNDIVLDMGTNQGALLLYASRFNPKKLIGLEINQRGCDLAKRNMELNNISNYEIINGDIITYTSTPVDVIICNPPYFKTDPHNKGDNKFLAIAKHEGDLTLDKLITSIKRNLKDNGTLYFLFMTPRLDEVLAELNKNNIIPKVLKFVYDTKKKTSNVFLVKAVKNAKKGLVVEKPIIIER
jgi:tRNA1(Val) A37 N6-methylase TrmN6